MSRWKQAAAAVAVVAIVGGAGIAYGQAQDGNPAPPAPTTRSAAKAFGDTVSEAQFVPITPCRIVDTREAVGKLVGGTARSYKVRGTGATFAAQGGKAGGCAVPSGAMAVEVTITAVDAENGFLRVWPGGSVPDASFMGYDPAFNVSNTGTVTLCGYNGLLCLVNQDLRVQAANGSTHVVIDVQGYYARPMAAVVTSAGALARGSRVVGVEKSGTGQYRVRFDRDVSDCEYSGTVGDVNGGDPNGYGAFTNATGGAGGVDKVFIHTYDATGASADKPFHLAVTC